MGQLGSSSSPAFAGWIQHGVVGYQFASKYTSPAFPIMVQEVHAYMDASGSSAVGEVVVWKDGGTFPILINIGIGTMAVGGNSAGAQAWHSATLAFNALTIEASTAIWIGGYSKGGIVFSTYDTNPGAWLGISANGSSGPGPFSGMSFSNQGPCGAYIIYSQIIRGSANLGSNGGGLAAESSTAIVKSGLVDMGTASPGGGLTAVGGFATTQRMGDNGGGLAPVVTNVKHNLVFIWRPA